MSYLDHESTVRSQLANITHTDPSDWHLVFKARYGMEVVFEELRLKRGAGTVLTQAFTCATAVAPILVAGHKPKYVDIEKDTMMIDPNLVSITDDVKAVVIQHTFGIIADEQSSEIAELAHDGGVIVLEDSAHSLGVICRDSAGEPVADVSIHSFGVEKLLPTRFGGAVWVNPQMKDQGLRTQLTSALENLPVVSGYLSTVSRAYATESRVLRHIPQRASTVMRGALEKSRLFEPPISNRELEGGLPHRASKPAPWMIKEIKLALDSFDAISTQRTAASVLYAQILSDAGVEVPALARTPAPLVRFPFFAKDEGAVERIEGAIRRAGYFPGHWYRPLLFPGPDDFGAYNFDPEGTDLPVSRDLSKRVVNFLTNVPEAVARDSAEVAGAYVRGSISAEATRYGNEDFVPVFLGSGLGAYGLARSLHEAFGVRSLALGRAVLDETRDSDIIDVRTYPSFNDPEFVVATLQELASEFSDRHLFLVPTIEFYTNIVEDHRDVLDSLYSIPLPSKEVVDTLMSKTDFYSTCEELSIPCPRTIIIGSSSPRTKGAFVDLALPFPVIVKPSDTDIYQRTRFAGKKKVYRADTLDELVDIVGLIYSSNYDGDLVLQEFLTGGEEIMAIANTYSDRYGKTRVIVSGQIVLCELNPTLVGNFNAIATARMPEIEEMLRRFLDHIGYVGYANFDAMFDKKTDQWKLLEINIRPGGSSFYTMASGINLAEMGVNEYVYGIEPPEVDVEAGNLWLNIPASVARAFAPPTLRREAFDQPGKQQVSTLGYNLDNSPRRLARVSRVYAKHVVDTVKNSRNRLNR